MSSRVWGKEREKSTSEYDGKIQGEAMKYEVKPGDRAKEKEERERRKEKKRKRRKEWGYKQRNRSLTSITFRYRLQRCSTTSTARQDKFRHCSLSLRDKFLYVHD